MRTPRNRRGACMRLSRASRGIDRGLCEFAVAIPPRLLRNVTPFSRARAGIRSPREIRARWTRARACTPRASAEGVGGGGEGGPTRVETCNFSVYISYSVDVAYAFSNYIRTS